MLDWADTSVPMGRYEATRQQSIRGSGIDPNSLTRGTRGARNDGAAPVSFQPEGTGAAAATLPEPSYPVAPAPDDGEDTSTGEEDSGDGVYETDDPGKSGDAPGHDPNGPGNSENAPGHAEDGLGDSLTTPGDSDEGSGSFGNGK